MRGLSKVCRNRRRNGQAAAEPTRVVTNDAQEMAFPAHYFAAVIESNFNYDPR